MRVSSKIYNPAEGLEAGVSLDEAHWHMHQGCAKLIVGNPATLGNRRGLAFAGIADLPTDVAAM